MRLPGSLSSVPGVLQRQAVLGPENDGLEHEADKVASRIVAGGDVGAVSPLHGAAGVQRNVAAGGAPGGAAAAAAVRTGGRALSASERGYFEPRFGRDFSAVRVHRSPDVDRAAAAIGARAYTVGSDIAVASGEPTADSGAGRRLMAHELTHTVQQAGDAADTLRRQSLPDLDDLADRAGRWGERQWERGERGWERAERWGERQRERGERYAGRGAEKAEELGARAIDAAEGWWQRGSGGIDRIDFDGAEVRLSGSVSATYKAVSGLMAHNRRARGVDYTGPEHQAELDRGPIPEGTYYVDPDEVESNPPGTFATSAWGEYRTRLHETVTTNLWRRATTERTGGFYLHQDADHNGTAGCIGIWNAADNANIHAKIKANGAQVPVHVKYEAPADAGSARKKGATEPAVQRTPIAAEDGQRPTPPRSLAGAPRHVVQRDPKDAARKKEPHYLVQAGIDKIDADLARHQAGAFPSDYYDTLARHLFEVALDRSGRDYGDAFSLLDDLQWNKLGPELQNHYTKVVGTDSANGWDKFRHFVFTAYLQYYSFGVLAPEIFTYGKELFDEAEHLVGKDPEGYSVPDIRADNRGEKFAEEMAARRDHERAEAIKRILRRQRRRAEGAAYRGLEALVDPRTYGLYR